MNYSIGNQKIYATKRLIGFYVLFLRSFYGTTNALIVRKFINAKNKIKNFEIYKQF